ncbi:host attachment protein [Cupriavidus pampae]|uniref:Host attachment protein n=1 Tax=Cupriavidus pampae TaxID=659251 RepID=A0ABM8XWH0_9BURK|nr:host attachment protein [Cupriavidus pampae]CAG9184752.1 hypothetical protein LMG32289_05725 [Cupriavidus pampae]
MKTTWVLIADEAIARIIAYGKSRTLEPVEEITDPDAHAEGAEMRRDAYGRRAAGGGQGSTQAGATASAANDQMHQHAEVFAKRVADVLGQAQQQSRMDALIIVAPPRFLGLLRKALPKNAANIVQTELDKDFVHFTNDDIHERLREYLR